MRRYFGYERDRRGRPVIYDVELVQEGSASNNETVQEEPPDEETAQDTDTDEDDDQFSYVVPPENGEYPSDLDLEILI
ncbi:Hypothetical predicted protein [Mytilus galloprovincialis]|uniref:Uncharacterized protein n=1 Tax=Mytilus galloprovincialis TaxID=29158 RepID=A0A8B6GIE9_MYTGA|nr:Hypothetical predicted protein [Mytilus galloprovincialis]